MDAPGAVAAWRELLGTERCTTDERVLAKYARTTRSRSCTPMCVLFPATHEEVQSIVRTAAACEVALYPLSRGRNWGYGDAAPLQPGAAMLDLSRMNRILEINRKLAYVVLEPGVSQGQLYQALQEQAPELWMDSTGAGPDASIVGNVLDRGFGHTPYGDHSRTTCALEVVTGEGEIVHTGFSRFPGAHAAHVFPHGLGLSMNELFTQSNFGIVTRMTVWLYPRPEAFQCFYLLMEDAGAIASLMEALRPLRLQGVLHSAVHVGNDLRVLSSQQGYPWALTGGVTPLPQAVLAQLRKEAGLGAWNMTASLAGTPAQVRGAAAHVRKNLGGYGKLVFVNDTKIKAAHRLQRLLAGLGRGQVLARKLEALTPNYGLLKGIPTLAPLQGAYWRLRETPRPLPEDPLETSCGLYWLSPVLPLEGEHARSLLALMSPVFSRHGFDLPVTFTLLNERAMVAVMNISFDRAVEGEAAQADACYEESMDALVAAGYYPYRLAPGSMERFTGSSSPEGELVRRIKAAFDPKGIIAPGRYLAAE